MEEGFLKTKTIMGKIFSGMGKGSFFTEIDWVKRECEDKLGFIPSPGTLNLKVEGESLKVIKRLKKRKGLLLVPPSKDFCRAKCYPVSIFGIKAALIFPEASAFTKDVHGEDVVEVISPLNLRETLSLKDGDEIAIVIEWRS